MEARALNQLSVACIQLCSGSSWQTNLEKSIQKATHAVRKGAQVIVFPENFLWRGSEFEMGRMAKVLQVRAVPRLKQFAKKHKAVLLLGGVLQPSSYSGKFYNTAFLIDELGKVTAEYQKIHLFDISLQHLQVQESRHLIPGNSMAFGRVFGTKAGLSICYDLRFPELYRNLSAEGCRILFVPADFTYRTGQAHWEVLLRARAIENQCFVIAAAQCGMNPLTKIKSFGTSMMVDPWGDVLGRLNADSEGVLISKLDLSDQSKIRREFPVLKHRVI